MDKSQYSYFYATSTTYLKYNLWTLLKVGGKTTLLALYACTFVIQLIQYWGTVHKDPREV